jgi:murein DD-endopeptidase MepM/ murein hydrolase activator NlpD
VVASETLYDGWQVLTHRIEMESFEIRPKRTVRVSAFVILVLFSHRMELNHGREGGMCMSHGRLKWSWSAVEERFSAALTRFQKRSPESGVKPADENNPWFELHAGGGSNARHSEVEPAGWLQRDGGAVWTGYKTSPRWLSDTSSPYGFSDDDGTLKQTDSSNWRNMFGAGRRRGFVPTAKTKGKSSRWQTSGTPGGGGTSPNRGDTWLLQTLAAAVLVIAGVYAHNTPGKAADQIRGLYQTAFQTDYSQEAIPAVEQLLNRYGVSLPVFGSSTGAITLHVPVTGNITEDYSSTHPEIFIQGQSGESVLAAGSGTVTQVVSVGAAQMVVIDHGKLGTTIYNGLASVTVKKGESVSSGELIGHLPQNPKPVLKFAMQQNGHYVNPHEYIHFPNDGV